MLPMAILTPGETYATVEQIRDVPDLAAMPVEIPRWQHADGRPFKILLRAPSFRDATEIDRAARTADGEDDDSAFVLETCLRAIVEPKFTRPQLEILQSKNPEVLDEICDTAWRLGKLLARAVEAETRRLADLPSETVATAKPRRKARAAR